MNTSSMKRHQKTRKKCLHFDINSSKRRNLNSENIPKIREPIRAYLDSSKFYYWKKIFLVLNFIFVIPLLCLNRVSGIWNHVNWIKNGVVNKKVESYRALLCICEWSIWLSHDDICFLIESSVSNCHRWKFPLEEKISSYLNALSIRNFCHKYS